MLVLLSILGLMVGLLLLMVDDKQWILLIFVVLSIVTCSVNEEVVEYPTKQHLFTALSNGSQVEGRGGLFHTTIDEEDYLIFWQEKENHLERKKIEINWNITKVYESDSEVPRIEIKRVGRKDTRKQFWFDIDSNVKVTEYNIYVPLGTVIKSMRLE
jgi:hypothetical protein